MATIIYETVAFGSAHAGLPTVGYALYDAAGFPVGSRVSAGVQDLGGGEYGAAVPYPDGFSGRITWDSGETTPVYASAGAPDALTAMNAPMPEGYAASGSPVSLTQAVYELLANVCELKVVGTTGTFYKRDHVTQAGTFTIDDGTDPTSRRRAT